MNARQIGDQLANGMQYSVICSEDEPLFAAANIDRAAMAKTYQGTEQVDALQEICELWPRGPVDADLHAPLAQRYSDPAVVRRGGSGDAARRCRARGARADASSASDLEG